MNTYPFLNDWLMATRRSEDGLIAVLIVAVLSVALLWFFKRTAPEDLPKLRLTMLVLFAVLSVGLAVMG